MTLTKKHGVYYANIRTPEGKTRSISTRATSLLDARRIAAASGVRQLETAARSVRLTSSVISQLTTGHRLTLRQAAEQFISSLGTYRTPRTIGSYHETLDRWITQGGISHLAPMQITAEHVSAWINRVSSTKAGSRAVYLAALRAFFDFCAHSGWCSGNPARIARVHLKPLSHAQKEPRQRLPFTEEQYLKLSTFLHDQRREYLAAFHRLSPAGRSTKHGQQLVEFEIRSAFWAFAVLTSWEHGLRLSDICRLEWDCFQTGVLHVHTDKHGHQLPPMPMSQKLQAMVAAIPATHPDWVWPEQRAVFINPRSRAALSVQFSRLCAQCGIEGRSFHSLRHAFARRKRAAGVTKEELRCQMGHNSIFTTEGYTGERETCPATTK